METSTEEDCCNIDAEKMLVDAIALESSEEDDCRDDEAENMLLDRSPLEEGAAVSIPIAEVSKSLEIIEIDEN